MGRKVARRRLKGRGAVTVLIALLATSALIRLGVGASAALAQVDLPNAFALPLGSASLPEEAPKDDVDIRTLLSSLQEREKRVAAREAQAAARAKALDVAQTEVERRIDALEATEQRLRETLSFAQTAAEDDITKLTTVYENMKPKDAAAVFAAMEPEFAAGFLGRMRPEVAARIMAGLDPGIAYSISAILAGRNAEAPKS